MNPLNPAPAIATALILVLTACIPPSALAAPEPVDLANPLIGTHSEFAFSHGNVYPAIAAPMGMTAWTPITTSPSGWIYQYQAETVSAMKATHQPCPWLGDYGDFGFFLTTGPVEADPQKRAAKLDHTKESAHPYRYDLALDRYGIDFSLAPTSRSCIVNASYPTTEEANLLFEIYGPGELHFDPATSSAWGVARRNHGGVAGDFGCYFIVEFNRQPSRFGSMQNSAVKVGTTDLADPNATLYFQFDTSTDQQLSFKIGTSFISLEQARYNLSREIGDAPLDEIATRTRKAWNDLLKRIRITSETPEQAITFYTMLYRSLLFPRTLHEPTSKGGLHHYSPYDGRVHPGEMFADNGFWDTFRAVYPLLNLVYPEIGAATIRGWINAYREGGWFPKWASPGYRDCMIGTHVDALIADAVAKDIREFDLETAYLACRKDATDPSAGGAFGRAGLQHYLDHGYVATDQVREASARTLEFAYDDWCVAQVANALGKEADAKRFYQQSLHYRNVFDPEVGFMRGRLANGDWRPDFDPTEWGGPFTEGSSWHYSWSVLHDVQGLINLIGGDAAFVAKLDQLLATPPEFKVGTYGTVIHEMQEMVACNMGQYAHGNEPVHHVLYLYAFAGAPWKAAPHIRKVVDTLYNPSPKGYCGDEDNGQMSAWYIFSTLGFYPVTPGTPQYIVGTPRFPRVEIDLANGSTLVINAPNNNSSTPFVRRISLNQTQLDRAWLNHAELMQGGELTFDMGATPNTNWATAPASRPYSLSNSLDAPE